MAGGGRLDPAIYERFVELAGGPDAPIVVIPTAGAQDDFPPDWYGLAELRAAGARNLTILHTRRRSIADSPPFVEPLRQAAAVWIMGGRSWRLLDAYLGTRTEVELHLLLARGGVIGGTSAGASIMASYLVRGAVSTNEVVMAPGHETGFGFLRGVAIDQHVLERGREEDLLGVVLNRPELLGIGLDEGAALEIQGDRAEVIGRSRVGFYNPHDPGRLFLWYPRGQIYDLARRIPARTVEDAPAGPMGH